MFLQISSFYTPRFKNNYDYNSTQAKNYTPFKQPIIDTVSFSGKSQPSEYKTVFQYLASEIIGGNKAYKIDGSLLSAKKIGQAVQQLIDENRVFLPYKLTNHEKIKWKSYIPQDIRVFSVEKINEARTCRMNQWMRFLQDLDPDEFQMNPYRTQLISKIQKNPSLKVVIWNAIRSELKESNRHIPVPFNEKALLETIKGFEKIEAKDRAVRCASPSFLEMYTHRLRDNLLTELGVSTKDSIWVKIPSLKHDDVNKERNIERLEILSCRNWCTRSSVDKARDALSDGDFYVYLARNKQNLWEPLIGMATSKGKIDQIQGIENNNIIPLNLLDEIKAFIKEKNLKCHSAIIDEGPKASQAIMISEKLSETDSINRTFAKVIKDKDDISMFGFLDVETKVLDSDGGLKIGTYRPVYSLNSKSGISVPYSMFGLNEDDLLEFVKIIDGDLILCNKNEVFNSRITKFPPQLEKVTGKIHCTAEQYEKFASDIDRLVGEDKTKLVIHR